MSRPRSAALLRVLPGAGVVLVGLFPAKDKGFQAAMDRLAAGVEARGGRVVGRFVQRRGVSHGGVDKMASPFSRRTLISPGKAREVADACRDAGAGAVVFADPLTDHQRTVLADLFACPVFSHDDLAVPGGTGAIDRP